MYKISELKTLIPFDIETLPDSWEKMVESKKKVWIEKYHYRFVTQEIEHLKKKAAIDKKYPTLEGMTFPVPSFKDIYVKYAGLYPEFSSVWCISFGLFDLKNELTVSTLRDSSEKVMLEQWCEVLEHYEDYNLAGYNINDFDIPFLLARLQYHGLNDKFPKQLQLRDAKPWTVKSVDFMNDWKNSRREAVSLAVVCELLEVPTPKDEFNNDEFTTLMTEGKITELQGCTYCEKDVIALGRCMVKCATTNCNFAGEPAPKKVWTKK